MAASPEEQIAEAYERMADEANYRPMAPSDGFGNITVPELELDIDEEKREYQVQWEGEEARQNFQIGTCNFLTRQATIFVIEAARCLCAADEGTAIKLLQMALEDTEYVKSTGLD